MSIMTRVLAKLRGASTHIYIYTKHMYIYIYIYIFFFFLSISFFYIWILGETAINKRRGQVIVPGPVLHWQWLPQVLALQLHQGLPMNSWTWGAPNYYIPLPSKNPFATKSKNCKYWTKSKILDFQRIEFLNLGGLPSITPLFPQKIPLQNNQTIASTEPKVRS